MLGGAGITCCAALAVSGCIAPPSDLTITPIVTGVDHPWDVGFAGNTMIYTERAGRISAIVGGQKRLLAAPTDVVQASEAGMMGLAVDPAFATNRYIYTCFASTLGGANNDVRLVRWAVNANFTTLTNRTDIVTGMPVNATGELGRHSGCRPRFNSAGRLWVGTGDAAVGTVPQDPRSLGGKILRVNRDGTGVAGNPGGALDPRIWSYGHRNVQGIAFRSDGFGVTTEHGPARDDELNALWPGNFGWNPVRRRDRLQRGRPDDGPSGVPERRRGAVEQRAAHLRARGSDFHQRLAMGSVERRAGHRPAQGLEACACSSSTLPGSPWTSASRSGIAVASAAPSRGPTATST